MSPIFKKGERNETKNYRGISVLIPVAKIFENILASQITIYLNINNILYSGQRGFRTSHSCETALHELLPDLNSIRDQKQIALLLFIAFRKAFDLVESHKLILKLFNYRFGNEAIYLIANYFSDQSQRVKFNSQLTEKKPLTLGVAQGSCLGLLFFLLFIND